MKIPKPLSIFRRVNRSHICTQTSIPIDRIYVRIAGKMLKFKPIFKQKHRENDIYP